MNNQHKLCRLKNGFTLIELLVVISIIGVLTAIILPNMMNMRERARDSKRKAALKELKTALRLYYNDYQEYPANYKDGEVDGIQGCGNDGKQNCSWGGTFSAGNTPTIYMKQLPSDNLKTYHYERHGDDNFYAWIELENTSDPDIEKSQNECGVTTGEGTPYAKNTYFVCAD